MKKQMLIDAIGWLIDQNEQNMTVEDVKAAYAARDDLEQMDGDEVVVLEEGDFKSLLADSIRN